MHVGDLALGKRIAQASSRTPTPNAPVDLARGVVLPEVVVGDHQVELRLGVVRVQSHRRLEVALRLRKVATAVRHHAEHVENVREAIRLLDDLLQEVLGFVELALLVVLAAEQEQLLQMVIHGALRSLRKDPRSSHDTLASHKSWPLAPAATSRKSRKNVRDGAEP